MENLLEIRNVSKKYPKFTLNDISFSIPKGSIVGFIGRNGAGKSTTLKGIMNLVHFDSGEVIAFDKSMKENELYAKQEIGFSLSEVNYYPNKTIKQIVDVIKKFYVNFKQEKFDKLCNLFNLDVNKKLEQLSSGMKVKYNLALALSHDAKLLILDEPTSGLDPISRDEICELFLEIVKNKERSILFSTHITSDLEKCATDIVYIRDGNIVFDGKKGDFINSYYLIKGNESSFNEVIKNYLISYKEHGGIIEGLISANNKFEFENNSNFELITPTLEEVMIYLERKGRENEEFTL